MSGYSENTIAMQEEEVMGRDLDYELCTPCVVQWSMQWFSAPTRLNQKLEDDEIKIAKYHEVVDMAITETINVHVEIGGCGFAQNATQRLGCAQGNERLGNGRKTYASALCR